MPTIEELSIKVFVDCADYASIRKGLTFPWVKGFTTNPSLVSQAGVADYTAYAQQVLAITPDLPVSFEVLSDTPQAMEKEARIIHSWGKNVYVKIPVINSHGEFQGELIRRLSSEGIALNVTAIFTEEQVEHTAGVLQKDVPALVSVFAGRIADVGIDPAPIMQRSVELLGALPQAELLWASTRELYNIFQADEIGCKVITAPLSMVAKLGNAGKKELKQCSIDAVKAFMKDIAEAGVKFKA